RGPGRAPGNAVLNHGSFQESFDTWRAAINGPGRGRAETTDASDASDDLSGKPSPQHSDKEAQGKTCRTAAAIVTALLRPRYRARNQEGHHGLSGISTLLSGSFWRGDLHS